MKVYDLVKKYGWLSMTVLSRFKINALADANIFFVDGNQATAVDQADKEHGNSFAMPFSTLDFAIGQCTAGESNIILVAPGHAENLAADSAVDIDVAGVNVVGLGKGHRRPTFTCTAAAGDFKLAAQGSRVENLLFLNDVDASTGLVEISAADCCLKNVEIREKTPAAKQADVLITTTASADRLHIDKLKIFGSTAAGANSAIDLVGVDDGLLENLYIYGNYAASIIECITTASLRTRIRDSVLWTMNSADICIKDTVTGSSLLIGPNLELVLKDNAANITEAVTAASGYLFDPVYVVNAVNEKAMLINWTASTDQA